MIKFKLSEEFLKSYKSKDPKFGFNGVGELAYRRTYSRVKADGTKEEWWETIRRVVEWVYNTQKTHIEKYSLGWEEDIGMSSAEEMYDRMFKMKFLPPGRGLWIAGTDILDRGNVAAALNNCAFVSTKDMANDPVKPFTFLMDMSMLGVGVGFDVFGAGSIAIQKPEYHQDSQFYIDDSREGWVASLKHLLDGFFNGKPVAITFDYSGIRKRGLPIKGFGGTASGPEPLVKLHQAIIQVFEGRAGELITETDITDIQNMIGACVVAGNVRRTAEIALGSPYSDEFLRLKDYRYSESEGKYVGDNAKRAEYGWTSNNSVIPELGMDYSKISKQIAVNGEPGLVWLDNIQNYSRMSKSPDYKDLKALGTNPCSEQSLESYELCCLVETFPTRNNDLADYIRTLKFAYLYAKTVTLCNTHWPETNRVMMRNKRIGTSMSGIAQFIDSKGLAELKDYCESGYSEIQAWDDVYSDWLCVPKSIKTTSVKPSGTVSLLAGCTPGIHWPEDNLYVRRMRIAKDSDLISSLREAGYPLLDDKNDSTVFVVELPVKIEGVRKLSDVSMWEQLSVAAFMQKYWADNQVSATITFQKHEAGQIGDALNYFQYQLKGVSFLPKTEKGVYHLMPYEEITEEEYNARSSQLKPIQWSSHGEAAGGEKFCSNDSCSL